MSGQISLLPWMRAGLASLFDGSGPGSDTISVGAVLTADRAQSNARDTYTFDVREFRVLGPGAVVGVKTEDIVRRDPEPGAIGVEPNYFASAEFQTADLPWRFTPGAPDDQNRLTPWLVLVVVEQRNGTTLSSAQPNRLQVLTIDDAQQELPPLVDAWAWAHAQYSGALTGDDRDVEILEAALRDRSPDLRARLICPRRLDLNRSYWACIVPSFAAGRDAGLGNPGSRDFGPAWTDTTAAITLPVYASWGFSTGMRGDFEALVNRLTPREMPSNIGIREMKLDVSGSGLPQNLDGLTTFYAGALVSPAARTLLNEFEERTFDEHTAIGTALADLVNKPHQEVLEDDSEADPVVAPPAYGRGYTANAAVSGPEKEAAWYDEINLKVRQRAAAGVASELVRKYQEELVDKAWDAAGSVRQANMHANVSQVSLEVGRVANRRLGKLKDADRMLFAAPAFNAMSGAGASPTVNAQLHASAIPDGLFTGASRRINRPGTGLTTQDGNAAPGASVVGAFLDDPVGDIGVYRDELSPLGVDSDITSAPVYQSDPAGGPGTVILSYPKAEARPRGRFNQDEGTGGLVGAVEGAQKPERVVSRALAARVPAVQKLSEKIPAKLSVAPNFRKPVYERLSQMASDLLLPGIGDIPPETVTILYPNTDFVRAFLVGMNHEMAREFLWREMPTPLNATWFRNFWSGTKPDIDPIANWTANESLSGDSAGNELNSEVVLVIRGTLPLRYPNLRIYALPAKWTTVTIGDEDVPYRVENTSLDPIPPHIAGRLSGDTFFFGLRIDQSELAGRANGGAGYFIVFEEIPGAPRFGFESFDPSKPFGVAPGRWDEISWNAVTPAGSEEAVRFLNLMAVDWMLEDQTRTGNNGSEEDRWAEDAASFARQTLQRPARVLIHASALVPD